MATINFTALGYCLLREHGSGPIFLTVGLERWLIGQFHSSGTQMVKTKGHFNQTEGQICIAVRDCPLIQSLRMWHLFFFNYSLFIVCPFESGVSGVWVVGKCHLLSLCGLKTSHNSSVIRGGGFNGSDSGLPTAFTVTPGSHSLFWRVAVC